MSAHLERAQLLLAQSRAGDAEREAMLALSTQPDNPQALALLALCRIDQDKRESALEAAREAVGLAPEVPHFHYVHAFVLHRMERAEEAFRAVQEALRLDPSDANNFSLLASIELARRNSTAALAAAEQALALNPEHVGAANLRAMALVRLGRKTEAKETIDFALHRAPENAFSHANQGWNCLHQNDPKQAQEHFREALRLEPEFEYAREGMIEALRARNPVYRAMLAYFLWMGRQSAKMQWALVLGVFFGSGIVGGMAAKNPDQAWFWWPLLGLFYVFVYLSWTAQPMFDLFLRFDRFGRHVLSADQRTASNWFGATLILTLLSAAWWLAGDSGPGEFATKVLAALSICVASAFRARVKHRAILGLATAALAIVAVISGLTWLNGDAATGQALANVFRIGFLGFQFLANGLASRP
jgi:tetratricopeptide (TPR) repeat protein